MRVRLKISGVDSLSEGTERVLSSGAVTIGRGANADWIVPDPERVVSKIHCVVMVDASRASLRDMSTNGTWLNGERVRRDTFVDLADGDVIAFFAIRIEIRIEADASAAGPDPAREAPSARLAPPEGPFARGEGRDTASPPQVAERPLAPARTTDDDRARTAALLPRDWRLPEVGERARSTEAGSKQEGGGAAGPPLDSMQPLLETKIMAILSDSRARPHEALAFTIQAVSTALAELEPAARERCLLRILETLASVTKVDK